MPSPHFDRVRDQVGSKRRHLLPDLPAPAPVAAAPPSGLVDRVARAISVAPHKTSDVAPRDDAPEAYRFEALAAIREVAAYLIEEAPDKPYEVGDWTDALAALEVELPD